MDKDEVVYQNSHRLPFDLLISFPPYVASASFSGLPADERGFIKTDLATRQVVGQPDIYAVGDAGDFPVKQAFGDVARAGGLSRLRIHRGPDSQMSSVEIRYPWSAYGEAPIQTPSGPD